MDTLVTFKSHDFQITKGEFFDSYENNTQSFSATDRSTKTQPLIRVGSLIYTCKANAFFCRWNPLRVTTKNRENNSIQKPFQLSWTNNLLRFATVRWLEKVTKYSPNYGLIVSYHSRKYKNHLKKQTQTYLGGKKSCQPPVNLNQPEFSEPCVPTLPKLDNR